METGNDQDGVAHLATSGAGGDGGRWGEAGAFGTNGNSDFGGGYGITGGPAGLAVLGNSNIAWIGIDTGERLGPIG